MKIKPLIISPPFSMYVPKIFDATYIRGSYTYENRPGAVANAFKYFRPTKDGWVNKQGLRNGGIASQDFTRSDTIWSLAGLNELSWLNCMFSVPETVTVELNLYCTNYDNKLWANQKRSIIKMAMERFETVIIKLPSAFLEACNLFDLAREEGVDAFHCCNTLPHKYGALSGRAIQEYSLPLMRLLDREGVTTRIAGGGIYDKNDVRLYRLAGATHFSLATIFVARPWNVLSVIKEINNV